MSEAGDSIRVVKAYLDDAGADLELAEAARALKNRHGAYHLQQAAEKLVKAVRHARDLRPTKEHRIVVLVDGAPGGGEPLPLPKDDPWRERLLALDDLSEYATTYRYPGPTGRLKPPPPDDDLDRWVEALEGLIAEARRELLGQ